jgi:hypothetical protein
MDNLRLMLATMSPEEFRTAARERELEEWRSSITDKRREVRRRDHRQLLHRALPSQCDVRRDGGEHYDVHGGDAVQDDDVS